MYDAMFRYWSGLSVGPPGGIVAWMNSKRSIVVRVRQAFMKSPPASCGDSLRPPRSATWHPAHVDSYAVRPAAAWSAVYTAWAEGCWPDTIAIARPATIDIAANCHHIFFIVRLPEIFHARG